MKRGSVFEVFLNRGAKWQVHEKAANGQVVALFQPYSTRYSALRAAKRKASLTAGSSWRIVLS